MQAGKREKNNLLILSLSSYQPCWLYICVQVCVCIHIENPAWGKAWAVCSRQRWVSFSWIGWKRCTETFRCVCVVTSYYVGGLQFENQLLHKPARPSDYILFWSFLYCHTIRLLPSPCFSSLCSLSAMLLNSSTVCFSNAKQMWRIFFSDGQKSLSSWWTLAPSERDLASANAVINGRRSYHGVPYWFPVLKPQDELSKTAWSLVESPSIPTLLISLHATGNVVTQPHTFTLAISMRGQDGG